MVALFFGSRTWTDAEPIRADLEQLVYVTGGEVIVVHGGADGADRIAGTIADELGLHVAVVRARWKRVGKHAGPQRNQAMLLLRPNVAYGYSLRTSGTRNMLTLLANAEIPTTLRDGVPA